jgi:bifunctional polynucleotide phosphatase/kinase
MFQHVIKSIYKVQNESLEIDMSNSFYCGDAAGRRKDHSNDDLVFSINVGLPFCTPEMIFQNKPVDFEEAPGIRVASTAKCNDMVFKM